MAVGPQPPSAQTYRILVDFPAAVVRDEEIQLAIVVVVQPAGSRTPHLLALVNWCPDSRLIRHICKSAVAVVSIQMILGHTGDVNIGPAIVIEIADRDPHIVTIARQSGLFRDVSEGPIMIVVVQAVVVFRGGFLEGWNCGAVNKEEVRVTIVVVID